MAADAEFVIGADGMPELVGGDEPAKVPAKTNGAVEVVEKSAAVSAEEGVEDLRRQLAERDAQIAKERQARVQAEALARENDQRATRNEAAATNSQVAQITSAIEAREAARASAKKAYSEALSAGDFDKAADEQSKMGELAAEVVALKRDKQAVEFESRRAVERAQADPVEGYIRQNGISGQSAAWLRSHPDAVKNPRRLAAADAAAQELEGFKPDTPEYFAYIEQTLGYSDKKSQAQTGEGDHASPENPRHRQEAAQDRNNSVSAPPSRKSPSIGGKSETKIVMTPAMKHHAEIAGLSEEEYARNWLAAKNAGNLIAH